MEPETQIDIKNSILLDQHNLFVNSEGAFLDAHLDTHKDGIPDFFKNYEYPISSWPVLMNSEVAKELKQLTVKLPHLLREIPTSYFNDDIEKIADFYFDGEQNLTQFRMMCHQKKIDISSRLDLTYTDDGFKVLEVNLGSSIGGWQIHSFESEIRKNHPLLSNSNTTSSYISKNTQSIYINFLIDKILDFVPDVETEINVFFCLKDLTDDKTKKDSELFLSELLKKELTKRGFTGEAFTGNISKLKLENSHLVLGNKKIHSVLILGLDEGKEIPPDLFRAFILDKIYFPDHLGVALLSDKRNLALLRELAMDQKFSSQTNELVLKGIPWTAIFKREPIYYKGEEYYLEDLLKQKQDEFVIKVAKGMQGIDVFIGKFMATEDWENIIRQAFEKQTFIAQEFSDSINFLAPDKFNEWTPHKLIWGSFGFGERYGGVWVRMSAIKTDRGVINSATGAVEAIVFETKS